MGFFTSLFNNKDETPVKKAITSPNELHIGDIVKMEFSNLEQVSGVTFKIAQQVFYDVGPLEKCKILHTMEGGNAPIYFSISQINPNLPLEISIPILPETVFSLFPENEFGAIFDEPENHSHHLNRKQDTVESDAVAGFVSSHYFQERTYEAYRGDNDCRKYTDTKWTGFDYKLLVSDDRKHAIRIEVYDGGRTDVYLIAYQALSKIEEYWKAS